MFSGQLHTPPATESRKDQSQKGPTGFLYSPFAWLAVYLLALSIRFWFNFQTPHINAYGACDASEYLRNATVLNSLRSLTPSFWQDTLACLFGQSNQAAQDSVRASLACLNELKISSPVFPCFLLAVFQLAGMPFDAGNWMLMLAAQSFISALTCVLIAHTAYLVWDRKIGFTAGLLSAIYPGFIVNSGRLYSETFAVFLMSLLVWLAVKDFHTHKATNQNKFAWAACQILKGATAICLQLTRSIMIVLTAALIPITILTYWRSNKAKAAAAIALMVLGCASIAVPWLALQKLAFGTSTLVVDRVGHYNFFTGNNVETQGWLSVPYPDGRGIEKKSLFSLWQEEFKKSPSGWLRLMQDKLPRLLKFPWNDFRTPIGPFSACQQITIHQIILLLSTIGIALSLFGNVLQRSNRIQLVARLAIFSLAAYQLVYCFFITVPRYNIAIMPLIAMFAAAGLLSLIRLTKNTQSRKTAISVTAFAAAFSISQGDFSPITIPPIFLILTKAILLFAFVIALWQATHWLDEGKLKARILLIVLTAICFVPVCLPVRAHGRMFEWQQTITNTSIRQIIELTKEDLSNLQSKNCYLLIDADGQDQLLNNASISINGKHLAGPFIPSLAFANDLSHVVPVGVNTFAFEQEYIFDCLTKEAVTSNANLRQWFLLPIPRSILSQSGTQLKVEITAKDKPLTFYGSLPSHKNIVKIPSLTRYSWEKAFYGVENTHGLTDTRYDQSIKLPHLKGRMLNIFLLSDDVPNGQDQVVSLTSKTSAGDDVELKLPEYDNDEIWLIRLTGEAHGNQSQAETTLSIQCRDKNSTTTYQSPWCQRLLSPGKNWHKFDCIFPLKPSTLPGTAVRLHGRFLGRSTLLAHKIGQQDTPPAEVRNLTAQVLHFPTIPAEGNYKLYLGSSK